MIAAPRVDASAAAPFLRDYRSCLGLASVDSYLYAFYPNSIRVYEQFSSTLQPELLQDIIVPHRRITHFVLSRDLIVVLMEDSTLEVRLRDHWEVVQFSTNLGPRAASIQDLTLTGEKVIFKFRDTSMNWNVYGFINLAAVLSEQREGSDVVYWPEDRPYQQLVHLHELGSIGYFYLGRADAEIRFGMYYGAGDNDQMKEFEFGIIREQSPTARILHFAMLNSQAGIHEESTEKSEQNLYIVRLIEDGQSLGQLPRRLLIKCLMFYQGLSEDRNQSVSSDKSIDSQTERFKSYQRMLRTLEQIQQKTNCIKSQALMNSAVQSKPGRESADLNRMHSSQCEILLKAGEKFEQALQRQDFLYICTNMRVHQLAVIGGRAAISHFFSIDSGKEVVEISQDKVYVCQRDLYVTSVLGCVAGNSCTAQTKTQAIQTESLSDVLLDQIEEAELHQMIDGLLEKKKVADVEVQTEPEPATASQQTEEKEQTDQSEAPFKSLTDISIGHNFPMCPSVHQQGLRKIEGKLAEVHRTILKTTTERMQQLLASEEAKMKNEMGQKMEKFIKAAISTVAVPAIEASVSQILKAKLEEANLYIYRLALHNLIQLKQEIHKDEARESMLRTELIRRQLYEVNQSKKAVTRMADICRTAQMQKVVFLEQVRARFKAIEGRVLDLEAKVNTMVDAEQAAQSKIYEEIEIIKNMLQSYQGAHEEGRQIEEPSKTVQEAVIHRPKPKLPRPQEESEQSEKEQDQSSQGPASEEGSPEEWEYDNEVYPHEPVHNYYQPPPPQLPYPHLYPPVAGYPAQGQTPFYPMQPIQQAVSYGQFPMQPYTPPFYGYSGQLAPRPRQRRVAPARQSKQKEGRPRARHRGNAK